MSDANMSEGLRTRLYELYNAYHQGRVDVVLDAWHEEADLISYTPVEIFPYLGRRRGKAAIAETLAKVHAEFEVLTYHPISMLVDKDNAATIVMARLRQRSTDRVIQLTEAHFIRLRDGRIIEVRAFTDSFDAVQQVLGHEIDTAAP